MSKKICFFLGFVIALCNQNAFADYPEVLSDEHSEKLTDKESMNLEDRLARKSIRGKDLEKTYYESDELRQMREFDQDLLMQDESLLQNSSLSLDAAQSQLLIQNLNRLEKNAKGYFRFEDRVVKYIEFYHKNDRGRSILSSWLKRQGRYRSLIENIFKKENIPPFLLYVAMIESGYNPHDSSNKGAVGLWQFMPEGARIYGLRVDYWVDERKDPVRATEAVARYFGDLHERFGSWHLALAAFNAGYGAVLRSIQKYNTNDFWKLAQYEAGLPLETTLYVPKAIATAAVGENRDLFGYNQIKIDPELEFDSIKVSEPVSLAKVAEVMGIEDEILVKLNPHLRRKRVPPLDKGQEFVLYIPKTQMDKRHLAKRIDQEAKEQLKTYVVPFGKRPEEIAKELNISKNVLFQLNGIEEKAEIRAGVTLLIPAKVKLSNEQTIKDETELVVVAVPDKNLEVPHRKQVFYRVIYGDTISGIAAHFKVKQKDLALWNHLDLQATLATGMVLSVWVPEDLDLTQTVLVNKSRVLLVTTGDEDFLNVTELLRGKKRILYTCKEGDTLESIAQEYKLSVASMERINQFGRNTALTPGKQVVVYQTLTKEETQQEISEFLKKRQEGSLEIASLVEKGTTSTVL